MGIKVVNADHCRRKTRYSKRTAKAVVSSMERKHGGKFNWFRCTVCGAYHVGSAEKFNGTIPTA